MSNFLMSATNLAQSDISSPNTSKVTGVGSALRSQINFLLSFLCSLLSVSLKNNYFETLKNLPPKSLFSLFNQPNF